MFPIQNNSTYINEDQDEAIIDLLFIMVLFGFVTCFMVLNYRLTYMKRTNSSKDILEDYVYNKSIVENIMYDRADI